MKKVLKKSLLAILLTILLSPNVFAIENPFYVNSLGVEMTESEYNYLLENFDEKLIEHFSQDFFDSAIEDINNIQLVDKKNIYFETTRFVDRNGVTTNSEREITEDEYNNFNPIQSYATCSGGVSCWETNAKKLTLDVHINNKNNMYLFKLTNVWKYVPSVKSYDVIAFRWTSTVSGFIQSTYGGTQYYDKNSLSYSYEGTNSKSTSSGVGISMNILDSTSNSLSNELYQYMAFPKKTTFNLYGTYQHATSDTPLNESMSYSFSSSGLGGVLYYSNSTIRNKYDGMQGVHYSFVPKICSDSLVGMSILEEK